MPTTVVVALRSDEKTICRAARGRAWASLTKNERFYVKVVEANKELFELFDSIERKYHTTGQFLVPFDLGDFEKEAFRVMHRFVDEIAMLVAKFHETRTLVDDFNYGQNPMPAY